MQQRTDEPYPQASADHVEWKIHQRHDKFMRFVFKDEQRCADITRDLGPRTVARRLADGPADVLNTTFTSKFLQGSECDARFEMATKDGKPSRVQYLVEFQSKVKRNLIVRILGYMVSALFEWEEGSKEDEAPAIVPMILHTGDGSWTTTYSLASLTPGLESLGKFVLKLFVHVVDFAKIKPKQLIGRNLDASACLLGAYFASARRRSRVNVRHWLYRMFGLPKVGSPVLVPLVVYIRNTYSDVTEETISQEYLRARPIDGVETLATASQEIVAEAAPGIIEDARPGIIEDARPGIIEDARPGIIEEVTPSIEARSRARMVTRTLENVFGPLPDEFRQRISQADERDVNRWMASFRTADSLDQIFNGSGKD